jgi:hypothetical protein
MVKRTQRWRDSYATAIPLDCTVAWTLATDICAFVNVRSTNSPDEELGLETVEGITKICFARTPFKMWA